MFKSLMPGLIGIKANAERAVELAARHGFAGVDLPAQELAALSAEERATLRQRRDDAGVRPGYCTIQPGRVPVPEDEWREAMDRLPGLARAAQEFGYTRAGIVLLPFHETLPYEQALEEHVRRFRQMLPILADHGISLGMEYVPAITRRAAYPHHFVYDMKGTLSLCAAIGLPNVGLLLDSFHWYCARETVDDIARLRPEQVVVVHVNDALPIPLEEQVVTERAMPGATGVIDLAGFFSALRKIGYDGPVTCEPMANAIKALNAPDDDAIAAAIGASMEGVLAPVENAVPS